MKRSAFGVHYEHDVRAPADLGPVAMHHFRRFLKKGMKGNEEEGEKSAQLTSFHPLEIGKITFHNSLALLRIRVIKC